MLSHILLAWLVLSVSVWLTAVLLPGFEVRGFKGAIVVAALLGLLNLLVGKLLFVVIGVATLGAGFVLGFVTRWVVLTIVIQIADALSDRLTIKSWKIAAVGALLMTALGEVGKFLLHVR